MFFSLILAVLFVSLVNKNLKLNVMDLNVIYNEDCLIGMQRIPDKSIDAIINYYL